MKILLAHDGSRYAEAALEEILVRPWPEGTHVRVVTAIEPTPLVGSIHGLEGYASFGERVAEKIREDAYAQIARALERLQGRPDLATSYEIRDGEVKSALLEAIREWEPDLVVAGSHGKTALQRFFLGSVSHALVSHAPCNVEIIKVRSAA